MAREDRGLKPKEKQQKRLKRSRSAEEFIWKKEQITKKRQSEHRKNRDPLEKKRPGMYSDPSAKKFKKLWKDVAETKRLEGYNKRLIKRQSGRTLPGKIGRGGRVTVRGAGALGLGALALQVAAPMAKKFAMKAQDDQHKTKVKVQEKRLMKKYKKKDPKKQKTFERLMKRGGY